jgi:hypothetical protein
MFSLLRGLIFLVLCLIGIGLFRGWFSFSNPTCDTQSDKVNVSVSVDAGKVEADVEEVKEKISEEVARVEQVKQEESARTTK